VLAYAAAEGLTVRLDGTEIQVRRPKANRPGRRAFVSGKRKQNTIKATIASDARGLLDQYPTVRSWSTPATAAWPTTTPTRSSHHPQTQEGRPARRDRRVRGRP